VAAKGPTIRRRRLAATLLHLRKESGKTREEVAEFVGCSPVTVNRIENARSGARVAEVARMLELYGVEGDERDALLQVAREARKRGWWYPYVSAMPDWFQVYVGLEYDAATIHAYEAEVIPGLFQTEGYARALVEAEPEPVGPDEIERRVALRIARQEVLTASSPPTVWAILGEAAIHRAVGGAGVLGDQLDRLRELAALPNVTLQVLPFAAGAHPSTHSPFTILGFSQEADTDVVYIELRTGGLYLEESAEIATYNLMFDHLRAAALSPKDTRGLLTST
jgi:transcriptional regulator with XRE-family HTH domain